MLCTVLKWRFSVRELFFLLEKDNFWKIVVIDFRHLKIVCVFVFSIILSLAFACDDRAATVDAFCECQASRAFCKVYILVSKAARCRNTGNWWTGVCLQVQPFCSWAYSRTAFPTRPVLFRDFSSPPLLCSPLSLLSSFTILFLNAVDQIQGVTLLLSFGIV